MGKGSNSNRYVQFLDAAQRLLFPRDRARDHNVDAKGRPNNVQKRSWRSKYVVAVLGFGMALSFVYVFNFYATTIQRIRNDPRVIDLAKPLLLPAKIHFGKSPLCGGSECWTRTDFDDSTWSPVGLPRPMIRELPGYDEGVASGWIYYRLRVPVPIELKQAQDVISLSVGAINHNRFEIWLNGRLIHEGQGRTSAEAATIVTLPRSDILAGDPLLVIKAQLSPSDVGISHSRGMLIGPKAVLDATYVTFERVNVTYYVLLFFAKGSVFIIFALVYFFTRAQQGFLNFLLYALFVTIENVIIMDIGVLRPDIRVLLYFLFKTLGIYFLLRFFVQHYRIYRMRKPLLLIGSFMIAVSLIMTLDHSWGSKTLTRQQLFDVTDWMLILTVFSALLVGVINLLLLRRSQVDKQALRAHQWFLLAVTSYFVLLIVIYNSERNFGLDWRMVLDLGFFYYMALANAQMTGLNEGRIVTLEAHFEEKMRMQQELQEAALIARALLPSAVPKWPFCEINVFHKSITEASGDWFAFERSPDGKLFHFILCDITGHGLQAAIIVSTCKAVLAGLSLDAKEAMNRNDFLRFYAQRLNHLLYEQGAGLHTATFLGLTFAPDEKKVYFLIGGHPQPYKIDNGSISPLSSRGNIVGVSEHLDLVMKVSELKNGDELIAFTDGIPLSTHVRTLKQFIQNQSVSAADAPRRLYEEVWREQSLKRSKQPDDDISIIWFKVA